MRISLRPFLYLLLDCFLLATSFVNTPNVVNRPAAPFQVSEREGRIVVSNVSHASATQDLQPGDQILSWGGSPIEFAESIEYLSDCSSIGTVVAVIARRGSMDVHSLVSLVPYYSSARFLVISLFVGVCVFAVGVFLLLHRPGDHGARTLHWALVTLGATIINTWGAVVPGTLGSFLVRVVWFCSYLGVAVSFLYFTLVFPSIRFPRFARFAWVLMIGVIALGAAFAALQMSALQHVSAAELLVFQSYFDAFHLTLLVFVGAGLVNVARSAMKAVGDAERRKMYWILWGLSIGALPYLLFHIVPQVVLSQYLLPEEFTTVFFLAMPVGFAIALLKYHLFDVELMINRTIVYGVISFFIVTGYGLVVLLMASLIGEEVVFERYVVVAAVTLAIGLAVNPLRLKLQHVVDEMFFPIRSNFQQALERATLAMQHSLSVHEVADRIVKGISDVMPAEIIAVYERQVESFVCRASQGSPAQSAIYEADPLIGELTAHAVAISTGAVKSSRWSPTTIDMSFSVCVPMRTQAEELLGFVALRQRHAKELYDEVELSFLQTLAAQGAEILERLHLQEKIILAQEERRRLEELNNLKSYFISSVSHELRMPLTSIRMFAEMLRLQRSLAPRQRREYLEIIEGETDRLSRLIGNILDFAKIERGEKEYHFGPVHVDKVVRRAVLAMRYQVLQQKACLRVKIQRRTGPVHADADALEEALLNLLSNALKYSTQRKEIDLLVRVKDKHLVIAVADKGIGISAAELPNIFDRFYRVKDDRTRQVGGAGLGLAVVKHIVEAHGGSVAVESVIGEGTTFRIEIPLNPSGTKGRRS